jgi:hypothetical protein
MSLKAGFDGQAIFWRNLLGSYCVGLDQFAPISVVACSDHGLDLDLIHAETEIRFYSLEENTSQRMVPVAHQEGSETENAILRVLGRLPKDKFAIACPVPSRLMDEYVKESGIRAACPPFRVATWLAEKRNWLSCLAKLGLPSLPSCWIYLSQMTFAEIRSAMGERFVAQRSLGVSGSGTAIIGSQADYERTAARFGNEPVRVAPFVDGPSLVVSGLVLKSGTAVGYPSVQIVGREECGAPPASYCGNDFNVISQLPAALIRDVQEQCRRIGEWMGGLGFYGTFGLDFVVSADQRTAYATDLNPRWLGSTAFSAQAEQLAGRIPLAALDLAAQLGVISEAEALRLGEQCSEPLRGSQMVLYSKGPDWGEVRSTIPAGIWEYRGGDTSFVRDGVRLADCMDKDEYLITGGVPRVGLRIETGSHLLRIYSRQATLSDDLRRLQPWARAACDNVYHSIALQAGLATTGSPA